MIQSRSLNARLRDERGNCFLYGCVTLVVLCILAGLIGYLVFRNFIGQVREKYTEAAPAPLPTVDMPADQIQALIKRVDEYVHDLRADKPLPTLTLSEKEVNALLQNHPDLKNVYGNIFYLTFADGTVTAQMSAPLDWIPGFRDRYFNGTATFDASVKNHDASIFVRSASVKGQEVPEQQIAPVRTQDFARDAKRKPDVRSLLDKIDSVKIEKGSITIVPSKKAGESHPAAAPAEPKKETPKAA